MTTADVHLRQVALQHQRFFIGQGVARHFAQFPHHLRLRVGLSMGRVCLQPAAEGGLVAAVGLIMQHAQPLQRGALLLGCHLDLRMLSHDAVPGGSRKLALQASRARIICFSTALWDTPVTLAISA